MNREQTAVMEEGVRLSLEGKISFPEVVRRLMQIGVERYHADYSRQEKTFYMPDGQSHVVPMPFDAPPPALEFSSPGVDAALRQIQAGKIDYLEFVRQTLAAGCVGYFVQITGRQALYFGRNGEVFVEQFPKAK